MSSFTPINIPARARTSHDNLESGPGPPANAMPQLWESHLPRPPQHMPAPWLPQLPLSQSLPSLAPQPLAPHLPSVSRELGTVEVIDLTGLSDGTDEGDGDEWEDVRDAIDLTRLPSDEGDQGVAGEQRDGKGIHQSYTILNLPRRQSALLNDQAPISSRLRPRRAARAPPPAPLRIPPRAPARVPARVPICRDICELCVRIVRWGPGCLITKHHLYPQEITKKYAGRYTLDQMGSIAFLCRPCHDAVHRAHNNRTLADFYYEVDLLKADPSIQAHVLTMQRATTPELIKRYGDGVNVVRRRKWKARAVMSKQQEKLAWEKQKKATGRFNLRGREARAPSPEAPPAPHVRRSVRLLAWSNGQSQAPIVVIEDDDEDIQDAVIHEHHEGEEDEERLGIVTKEELAALEAIGEYIPL